MKILLISLISIMTTSAQAATIKFILRVNARDTDQGEYNITSVRTKAYGASYVDIASAGGDIAEIKKDVCERSGLTLGDILSIVRQKNGKVIVTRDQSKRVFEVNVEESF